ncbi:MAG: leucyl/phenylalanyl-tRNA--protein transferase, partial [Saprospiraceae bacterium]|nr:leucyl/phenylalanyl-tRNA--protein transferase [Saprospiraceae bacterium]
SMRPYFNNQKYAWTIDRAFEEVITQCQLNKRKGQNFESWITDEMKDAYIKLHEAGFAHSVEVWENKELVGGLYGVCLGKVFFGESMFSKQNNASKFGFISFVKELERRNFALIDCQQKTKYLVSLGARGIPRVDFQKTLRENVKSLDPTPRLKEWPLDQKDNVHLPDF